MRDYEERKILLYTLQDGKCLACGRVFSINDLTIDHVLPKKRAGETSKRNPAWIDEIINLRLLCLDCHLNKRPKGFAYWDIEKIETDIVWDTDAGFWIGDDTLRKHYRKTMQIYKAKKANNKGDSGVV